MAVFDANDPTMIEKFRQMLGPDAVQNFVNQAIYVCWIMLPKERRNAAAVEAEIRRAVDCALKELREKAPDSTLTSRESEVRSLAERHMQTAYGTVPRVFAIALCTRAELFGFLGQHAYEARDANETAKFAEVLQGAGEGSRWWVVVFEAFRQSGQAGVQTCVQLLVEDESSAIHEFKQVHPAPPDAPGSGGTV
jgi:hypothetical protein